MMTKRAWLGVLALAGVVACDSAGEDKSADTGLTTSPGQTTATGTEGADSEDTAASTTSGAASEGTTSSTGTSEPPIDPPVVFDFGAFPDVGAFCGAPNPVSCDNEDDDPWHAMGLNCDGGPQVDGSFTGDPEQLFVHEGNFGTSDAFPPREGDKFAILSSGIAEQMVTTVGGTISGTMGGGNLPDLPPPMTRTEVSPGGGDTCIDNPALVGTGDCSNTVEVQYSQGGTANDLAFLSLSVEVPENTFGFTYDFAFFSVEYPVYYQSQFNDMYVAWLESEGWTGNISFDEFGSPISLNAGFLDYKDAPNPTDCPAPCVAPELAGTAAQGHAGTRWLTTNAPVTPGETIEVYFAIFDLSDTALDSAVLLDNWIWTCEGSPPVTIPG